MERTRTQQMAQMAARFEAVPGLKAICMAAAAQPTRPGYEDFIIVAIDCSTPTGRQRATELVTVAAPEQVSAYAAFMGARPEPPPMVLRLPVEKAVKILDVWAEPCDRAAWLANGPGYFRVAFSYDNDVALLLVEDGKTAE